MLRNKLYQRARTWVDKNKDSQCWGVIYKTWTFPIMPLLSAVILWWYILYRTDISLILHSTAIELMNARPDSEPVVVHDGVILHFRFKIIGTFYKWAPMYIHFSFFKLKVLFFIALFIISWQVFDFFMHFWTRSLVAFLVWMKRYDLMPKQNYNRYWYRAWSNSQTLFYIERPSIGDTRYLSYELADYFLQYRAYHPKGVKFYDNIAEQLSGPWFSDEIIKYGGEFNWWLYQINYYSLSYHHINRETVILRSQLWDKYYYRGRHVFTINNVFGVIILYHNSDRQGRIGSFSVGNL